MSNNLTCTTSAIQDFLQYEQNGLFFLPKFIKTNQLQT